MKNITPSNPLKTFNDNKALAIKKMGGATLVFKKSLRKAQTGETGAADTEPVTVADTPKPKDYVNMSNKEFRAEKQGGKRAKKLEDIASGANRERTDKIINTVGNIASTAANVTGAINTARGNIKNNNNSGSGTPPFKKGGTTKALPKAQFGAVAKEIYRAYKGYKKAVKVGNIIDKAIKRAPVTKSKSLKTFTKKSSKGPIKKSGVSMSNTLSVLYKTFPTLKNKKK